MVSSKATVRLAQLCLAIGLLELSRNVHAIDLHIDAVRGNDSTTCGSESSPCRSVSFTDTRASAEPGTPHTLRLRPGTYTFLDDARIPNSGGWNRLIGDRTDVRAVVLDGQETSERLVSWQYSTNNQSGPFYFEWLTFTGFTDSVIALLGQHLVVRDCVFDFSHQHGAQSIEAATSSAGVVWQEQDGSNTSTLFVENVVTFNGNSDTATGVNCDHCYNVTVLDSRFYNGSDIGRRGAPVLRCDEAQYVHVENVEMYDSYSCYRGGIELAHVPNAVVRNVAIHGVYIPDGARCFTQFAGTVFIDDCDGHIQIDGLTVTNATGGEGAGVFMEENTGLIELDGLTMMGNTGSKGGGVYIEYTNTAHVVIRNSHFEDLLANDWGGAIGVDATLENADGALSVEISDCTFVNNRAVQRGGAINFEGGLLPAEVVVENCDFRNNLVDDGGGSGGALNVHSDMWNIRVTGGSIIGNEAEFGAGVYVFPGESSMLTVEGVEIAENVATVGGAFHMGGAEVMLSDCEFHDNEARDQGGAVYVPQGIGPDATLTVNASTFMRHSAEHGGSFFVNGGVVNVIGCTIADSVAGLGGGFYMGRSSRGSMNDTKIANCNAGGESVCVGSLGYGGGVYFQESACLSQQFDSVSFEDNLANVSGGAYFTQDTSCGDDWCTNCDFDENLALGFGSTRAAPFAEFRSADRLPVSLGEEFSIDAAPHDAFGQLMTGDHELITAALLDPNEHTNAEVLLCGELSTTASRGFARFTFMAYLVDTGAGESTTTKDAMSSGNDVVVPLYLRPKDLQSVQKPVLLTELALQGCEPGFEVDMIPAPEVEALAERCRFNYEAQTDGSAELPPLLQCIRQSNLTDGQRATVLTLSALSLLVGACILFAVFSYRNNRIVWSSSPFMVIVAAVGFLLLEAAAFLRAFRPTSSAMCMSYLALFILGLNLVVGSAIAKNLRVWKIFTLKSLRTVHIANWKLLVGILIASIPELIIILVQSAAFPLTVDLSVINSSCRSDTEGSFLGFYGALKALWLLAGVGTCWLVREVPKKFNEMKSTAVVVTIMGFGLVIIWGIGATVLSQAVQERTILEAFVTSLVAVLLISVYVVPKLFVIYKGNDGTLLSNNGNTESQTSLTFSKFKTNDGASNKTNSSIGDDTGFEFKSRFKRLKDDLARTQKLYQRSHQNTQELRQRFRTIESDLVALQFERDYRADVAGEDVSDVSGGNLTDESTTKSNAVSHRRSNVGTEVFEELGSADVVEA